MRPHFHKLIPQILIFLSLGLLIGFALSACATASSGLAIGDEAPGFTLSNSNGQFVALRDYTNRQQPVLLYFHMALG